MANPTQERQARLEALRAMIEREGKVSMQKLTMQITTKWGLTELRSKEYIRCLTGFPNIHAESGYLQFKK